jgi:hypothetical protein
MSGARGAPRAHSKRKRLDVGVLPYFFVLFLLDESVYSLSSFVGWFIRLVDLLGFVLGVVFGSVVLSFWFDWLVVHFGGKVLLVSFYTGLAAGGGGC